MPAIAVVATGRETRSPTGAQAVEGCPQAHPGGLGEDPGGQGEQQWPGGSGNGNAPAAATPAIGLRLITASQPARRRGWPPSSAPVASPSANACTASATATAADSASAM